MVTKHIEQVVVPDLSGETHIEVIDVLVAVGNTVSENDSLITLEGNKATMDVPSPIAGHVKAIQISVGDRIKEGDPILQLEVSTDKAASKPEALDTASATIESSKETATIQTPAEQAVTDTDETSQAIYASPAVRRIGRELGIDLKNIPGSGLKNRVTKEDVQQFVQRQLQLANQSSSAVGGWPSMPVLDFSKFGDIEPRSLSKIKKITGINLARNWATIPHVTQFSEADITECEAFRQSQKPYAEQQKVRLTLLPFIMKAVVAALKEYPSFNASLDTTKDLLILKKYFNIGVAVDTPSGLVVPVIRHVDQKGLFEIARELTEISEKARTTGLSMADMQGGCFSLSNLGGIGGMGFTPIINAPEVAILGISQTQRKAVLDRSGNSSIRLMLPLSLSYDHRVIDGAEGARFAVYLTERLREIRTLLL